MNKILSIIVNIILIGLIVWIIFFRKVPVPDPIVTIDYQYITDTVYLDTLYLPGKPYPVNTPPNTIKIFLTDSAAIDSLKILLREKDILISGLEDSISIHQNYLKQFPNNPKLLAIDLKRDSMYLGLLQITGQVQEHSWPIDLNNYAYRWNYPTNLSRHEVQQPPTLKEPFANYFVGGGVDILYKSPIISGQIEKNWTSLRLYGTIDVGLLSNKASSIKAGIYYKFGWGQ